MKTGYAFRDWVFTLNNPTPEKMDRILDSNQFRYIVYQLELSATGTRHLQGYIEFKKAVVFHEALEFFSSDFHFERRRATRRQARDYCSKEESRVRGPWSVGVWIDDDDTDMQCQGLTKRGLQCKNVALPEMSTCGIHKKE